MVSIIILSYNTSALLKECLLSVEKALDGFSYEIIVVDNASHDDSVAMIKKHFKKVRLIENSENAGFAKGCNLGSKSAKGEYLLFLNSDTFLKENPLPQMLKVIEKDKKNAIVGGLLKNHDGSPQRSFGPFYGLKEVSLMLFGGEKTELLIHQSDGVREVDWVSGGFMMVRAEVFKGVHGFDEQFFMYIEDMELCYRVTQAGYRVLHTPLAVVTHLGQGSSNKGFAVIHIFKGLKIFYKKHKNKVSYILLVLILSLKGYCAIVVGMLQKNPTLIQTYRKALS